MRFPSLKHLVKYATSVVRRFPIEIIFSLIGTIAAIALIELDDTHMAAENWCLRIMMISNLGLVLSISATLFSASRNFTGLRILTVKGIPIFISLILLFLLNPDERQADWGRFILLALSLHLLVSCAGFFGNLETHQFWQFNKTLFLRILTGSLYSLMLFLGLSAAISAMNFLFNFNFEYDTFLILWVCIVGLFNTVFFLAGVPELSLLAKDNVYPKSLKIFTQYVLIPLATVYVIILLAYELKILLEWNLPKGLVSNLILGYAVFGILSLLLVYPLRNLEENKWIKTYSRIFYFLLIPLLILLFLAIGKRVFDYGITENRYFLILLALWLSFITVYFLISARQNIRLIPLSLLLFGLFALYGPQSAFSVSTYAQERILVNIFLQQGAFANSKLIPLHKQMEKKDAERVISTLQYLVKKNDLTSLQLYLKPDLQVVIDSLSLQKNQYDLGSVSKWDLQERKLRWLRSYLKVDLYVDKELSDRFDYNPEDTFIHIKAINPEVNKVTGYDYVIIPSFAVDTMKIWDDDQLITLIQNKNKDKFTLKIESSAFEFFISDLVTAIFTSNADLERYNIHDIGGGNMTEYQVPKRMLLLHQENTAYQVDWEIKRISFRISQNGRRVITDVSGNFLVRKR
ncbi:MAG: DUF4153 domain-containing protein [Sphingobacteriaceae bacterium]